MALHEDIAAAFTATNALTPAQKQRVAAVVGRIYPSNDPNDPLGGLKDGNGDPRSATASEVALFMLKNLKAQVKAYEAAAAQRTAAAAVVEVPLDA